MQKTNNQKTKRRIFADTSVTLISFVLALALIFGLSAFNAFADPEGASLTYVSNSTRAASAAASRTDPGGYITTVNVSSTQQNSKWKAYVGNVSGSLTLDDSATNTIYDWTLTTISGEVYATRASSVTWASIACASLTNITGEDSTLGFVANTDDTINSTFSNTAHVGFSTAGVAITASSCRSVATHVSDAAQTQDVNADFQEVLLTDSVNLIYATILEQDATGYDGSLFDFQMIVADNVTTQDTTYYFFVELG